MSTENDVSFDLKIRFDEGPEVDVRSLAIPDRRPVIAVRPFYPLIEGVRIFDAVNRSGIGIVTPDGVGLYPTVLGAEFTADLEGSFALPPAIEMSVRMPDGSWVGVDVTDRILDLDTETIKTIEDGQLPRCLAGAIDVPAIDVELAGAVSYYFGAMPDPGLRGARVSAQITSVDVEQARIVRSWTEPSLEQSLSPGLSPSG